MLEIYPQEDMNTQAIRELTDEVFNLKQKTATNADNITALETEIESLKPKLKMKTIPVYNIADFTINAGSISSPQNIYSGLVDEGQTMLGIDILYTMTTGSAIIPVICVRKQVAIDAQQNRYAVLQFFNPTADSQTVETLALRIYYEE